MESTDEREITAADKEVRVPRSKAYFPFLVLVAGIALSILLHFVIRDNIQGEAQLRFERQASDAQHVISARIHSYADVMYGLRAMFSASPVSRTQFHRYVTGLDLAHRYPGFWGFNYAERVSQQDKAKFEERVRKDTSLDPRGYPNFAITPPGNRLEYYVLTYLEPMAGNERLLGLDIASNPSAANPQNIAAALASARDSGNLTSSGELLRIKGPEPFTGLSMRLPVYRSGMPLETVEQRRVAYLGSVGAGFRVKELMRGVLDEHALEFMRFKLYEAGPESSSAAEKRAVGADRLLFDSNELVATAGPVYSQEGKDASSFRVVLPISVAGRVWEVHFSTPRAPVIGSVDAVLPWLVLAGGLLSSLLLFAVLRSIALSHGRAVEMAQVITKDLRESEATLAKAQRIAQLGNWLLDPVARTMTWSEETYRILGLQPAKGSRQYREFMGRVHEKDRAAMEQALQHATEAGREYEIDHRIFSDEGETRWVQTIVQPAQSGGKTLLHGTIRDITDSKLAAVRLQIEHGVSQLVAGATDPDEIMPGIMETICKGLSWECGAYWSMDKEGVLLRCTATWGENSSTIWEFLALTKKMSAPSGVDLPGRTWARGAPIVVENIGSEQSFSRMQAAQQAGLRGAVTLPIVSGGKTFGVIELYSAEVIHPDEALTNVLHSVSTQIGQSFQRKLAEDQLRYIATHDSLTDLPNRAMFNESLRHALQQSARYGRGIAVLFIDIDRFKVINDSLGHGAGDRLLQDCANRLSECLRESDTVARLGGDEFVVMVENFTAPRDAIAVAQKVLTNVSKPFFVDGQEFLVSASIGISTYPDDGADAETLLKNADIAMYRAKDQGRNNYQFYSAQMNKHTFERLAMESSLRRALEKNEFVLHYQPKLDLRSGAIAGVEALVRWRHPDWGMVSPAQFIPLAEETGQIVQIGEWVLKTACEQSRMWRDQGIPAMRVAVNLSARQFGQKTLLADVARTIAESGLTPECLELEITESFLMHNPEHAADTLHKLKAMGITLSIDDFGTGYSSLAYLKRFPIDCVKIDRSFIKDIPNDSDDMAITKGVIALGHSLRLKVVAEGVETAEQREFLRSNGCDELQGYLFSKPLPAEDVTALLKSHSPKSGVNVVEPRKRA
ncbi:MAG TPA: EAL domain-containing protein [Burkholderiales bacterium]|nr:EAL domain-containing protein [Burkholderiales bacterium]